MDSENFERKILPHQVKMGDTLGFATGTEFLRISQKIPRSTQLQWEDKQDS